MSPGAKSAVVATAAHETSRVVLVVLREGLSNSGARSRVETLSAFSNSAALIVSNALLHEERAVALARQVDLNRQKGDFVAAVSHELRTPLAVMLGSVHTLERLDGRMTDEQRSQLFDMTVEQGGRLQRLIDELLLVAAAEHAEVQLQYEPIEIAELFASVTAATATSTGHRVEWSAGRAGTVVSDRSKVERILLNLVENAAKYAPGERIELGAAVGGSEVHLSVVDHGPGIPENDRDRVFERFVQLDQSSTRRQGGTGLGLHLCRRLAELVGARTTLTETPGGGCTFTLSLPERPHAAPVVTRAPDAHRPAPQPVTAVRARPAELARLRPESVR